MNEKLFREKSLDKIKSPENMNDYIKVTSPAVWLVLAAVVILLAGAFIWGTFGKVDTVIKCTAVAENRSVVCEVADARVNESMKLRIDGSEYEIEGIKVSADKKSVTITAQADLSDGIYDAEIVVESIKPLSFVLN